MSTLYELTGELKSLIDAEAPVFDIVGDIKCKVEDYCKVRAEMNMLIRGLKDEEQRLAAKRKTIENNKRNMMERVAVAMDELDIPKIKTELFSVTLKDNPPSLVQSEDAEAPERFVSMVPKVDSAAIKAELRNGEKIEGFELVSLGKSVMVK